MALRTKLASLLSRIRQRLHKTAASSTIETLQLLRERIEPPAAPKLPYEPPDIRPAIKTTAYREAWLHAYRFWPPLAETQVGPQGEYEPEPLPSLRELQRARLRGHAMPIASLLSIFLPRVDEPGARNDLLAELRHRGEASQAQSLVNVLVQGEGSARILLASPYWSDYLQALSRLVSIGSPVYVANAAMALVQLRQVHELDILTEAAHRIEHVDRDSHARVLESISRLQTLAKVPRTPVATVRTDPLPVPASAVAAPRTLPRPVATDDESEES